MATQGLLSCGRCKKRSLLTANCVVWILMQWEISMIQKACDFCQFAEFHFIICQMLISGKVLWQNASLLLGFQCHLSLIIAWFLAKQKTWKQNGEKGETRHCQILDPHWRAGRTIGSMCASNKMSRQSISIAADLCLNFVIVKVLVGRLLSESQHVSQFISCNWKTLHHGQHRKEKTRFTTTNKTKPGLFTKQSLFSHQWILHHMLWWHTKSAHVKIICFDLGSTQNKKNCTCSDELGSEVWQLCSSVLCFNDAQMFPIFVLAAMVQILKTAVQNFQFCVWG